MKSIIQSALGLAGLQLRRVKPRLPPPATAARPLASIECFLEDVRARGFQPKGIIDVGANEGEWTRLALSNFPSTPVLMIEPQSEMESRLKELAAANPGCRYVQAGAGREAGELVQTIWDDLSGSSFLPATETKLVDANRQRKTPIVTIDSLLAEMPAFQPDLVKLDVQGFEIEVLAGATSLFGKTELFVIETSLFSFMPGQPISRNVISLLADHGYEIYDITEFYRRPHDGALGQVDFAFVKKDGLFRRAAVW